MDTIKKEFYSYLSFLLPFERFYPSPSANLPCLFLNLSSSLWQVWSNGYNKKGTLPIFLLPFAKVLPLPRLLTYLASLLIFLLSLWLKHPVEPIPFLILVTWLLVTSPISVFKMILSILLFSSLSKCHLANGVLLYFILKYQPSPEYRSIHSKQVSSTYLIRFDCTTSL